MELNRLGKRDLKVTYENGEVRFILINPLVTFDEIKEYFLNQYFNVGNVNDNVQKCIAIEFI